MSKPIIFNTTLKCGGCVAAVKPGLDALKNIESWQVDLSKPVKTVTVIADDNAIPDIENVFKKAGYQAQPA